MLHTICFRNPKKLRILVLNETRFYLMLMGIKNTSKYVLQEFLGNSLHKDHPEIGVGLPSSQILKQKSIWVSLSDESSHEN